MPEPTHAHCLRCDHEVAIERQHSPRLRRALKAYFVMPVLLVPLFPFLAWDYVVSIPIFMLYVVGMGRALAIVREPPTCSVCGAYVPVGKQAIEGTPPSGRRRVLDHAHRETKADGARDRGITLRVRSDAAGPFAFAFAR